MKTITVCTRGMYQQISKSSTDIFWDDPEISHPEFLDQLHAVASEDMEKIRKMFKDGYTAMLLSCDDMDILESTDDEVEVRVYSSKDTINKLLGVVIDSELSY